MRAPVDFEGRGGAKRKKLGGRRWPGFGLSGYSTPNAASSARKEGQGQVPRAIQASDHSIRGLRN